MNKTIIYSCNGDMTTADLVESTLAEVWWPEIKDGRPLSYDDQVELAFTLVGKTIVTISEIIILTFLKEIDTGRMSCDDLELFCNGDRIGVGADGELINAWPGGFYDTRATLLFY